MIHNVIKLLLKHGANCESSTGEGLIKALVNHSLLPYCLVSGIFPKERALQSLRKKNDMSQAQRIKKMQTHIQISPAQLRGMMPYQVTIEDCEVILRVAARVRRWCEVILYPKNEAWSPKEAHEFFQEFFFVPEGKEFSQTSKLLTKIVSTFPMEICFRIRACMLEKAKLSSDKQQLADRLVNTWGVPEEIANRLLSACKKDCKQYTQFVEKCLPTPGKKSHCFVKVPYLFPIKAFFKNLELAVVVNKIVTSLKCWQVQIKH